MKKRLLSHLSFFAGITILTLTLLLGGSSLVNAEAQTLYGYYNSQGQQLPSLEERSVIAAELGIFEYSGTAKQNEELLFRLQNPPPDALNREQVDEGALGVSVVTNYRTSLRSPMTSNQTTVPVSSLLTSDGTTITSSTIDNQVYLTLAPGSDAQEIVKCTGVTSENFTNCTRGLSFSGDSETSVSDNKEPHSAGTAVVMSNVHYVFNKLVDNTKSKTLIGTGTNTDHFFLFNTGDSTTTPGFKYTSTTNQIGFRRYGETGFREIPLSLRGSFPDFASLPTSGNSEGDIAITSDDDKIYVWDSGDNTWVLAGGSSGAGTVYRTFKLGSEADGSDNRTFTLDSGSWPESKFLQVTLNGVDMREGASYDYTIVDNNTIEFNYDVLNSDTIGMYVVSVDLYNAEWVNVNTDLLPDIDATHDIGSSTLQFKDAYFSGDITATNILGTINEATTTPTADKIPQADGSGKIDNGWENISIDLLSGENISGSSSPLAVFVSSTDGLFVSDSGSTTTDEFYGFVSTDVNTSTEVTVQTNGIVTGFSSLTAGSDYFLSTSGSISSTAGTYEVRVGKAVSSTAIKIDLNKSFQDAESKTDGSGGFEATSDGIVFVTVDAASNEQITLSCSISLDGGDTWTLAGEANDSNSDSNRSASFPVKKGEYYRCTESSTSGSNTYNFEFRPIF